MSFPKTPPRPEFSLDDERVAAAALACITLRRGIRLEKQVAGVRAAMTRLEELGLATVDHADHGRCHLTDDGRALAREFHAFLRATLKRVAEKRRAA